MSDNRSPFFADAFVDELRKLDDPLRWFDEDTIGDLAVVYEDKHAWGKALTLARRVGVAVNELVDCVRRERVGTVEVPEMLNLETMIKSKRSAPKYVIDRFLPLSGLSVVAGGPKAGKSTFARYLMVKIASGQPVFGKKTAQGPCLYYVLEEKLDEVVDDFRRYGLTDLPIHIRAGRLPKRTFLPLFIDDVKETGAVFAVADPLFDVLDVVDASEYVGINMAMKEVVDTVRSRPVHLMFLHHSNKSGIRSTAAMLGSRAIEGATDVNVMLDMRDDGVRMLYSVPRYGDAIPLSKLVIEKDTRELRLIDRRPA